VRTPYKKLKGLRKLLEEAKKDNHKSYAEILKILIGEGASFKWGEAIIRELTLSGIIRRVSKERQPAIYEIDVKALEEALFPFIVVEKEVE
jgi:hypothetical protein